MLRMVVEPATSNRPLTHANLFIPQWPGGSAAVEHAGVTGGDMQFTVTRHTPRHRPPRWSSPHLKSLFHPPERG